MSRTFSANSANRLENTPSLNFGAGLTISSWFKAPSASPSGTRTLFCYKNATSSETGFDLQLSTNGRLTATAYSSGAASAQAGSAITASTWQHGCARFVSTTSRFCYFNGVAGTENTTSKNPSMNTTNDRWAIGVNHSLTSTYGEPWDGDLAEIAIWNVALSAGEITALSRGVCPILIQKANLQGYWPLYGLDSPERDFSPGYRGDTTFRNQTITGTVNAGTTHAPVISFLRAA